MSTVNEIVDRPRTDPAAYKAAAEQDSPVWAREFSSPDRAAIMLDDQAAAQELRINRDRSGLLRMARQGGWKFESALSLGCGGGRAERLFVKSGICDHILGIDVSEGALQEARSAARAEGLATDYQQGDLNSIDLKPGAYDLIISQTCLHHVLELERPADQIAAALVPGGCLWVDDFIGESQFQWLDLRLEIANIVLRGIPQTYRYSRMNKRLLGEVVRRLAGTLISPFESIRSGEIVQIFSQRFETEWKSESNTLMHLIAPVGTLRNYAKTDSGRALFDIIHALDRSLLLSGTLPPLSRQYIFRSRTVHAGAHPAQ